MPVNKETDLQNQRETRTGIPHSPGRGSLLWNPGLHRPCAQSCVPPSFALETPFPRQPGNLSRDWPHPAGLGVSKEGGDALGTFGLGMGEGPCKRVWAPPSRASASQTGSLLLPCPQQHRGLDKTMKLEFGLLAIFRKQSIKK